MNVSFIALNISGAETVQSAADKIRGSLSGLGSCDFRLCGSMAQVSAALSDAFAGSDIIAVGAEPSAYPKAKLAILRAMHVKTELNEGIRAVAEKNNALDTQQLSMHCAMPEGADVFLTEDGLLSGFAIKSGRQHFVMLPLDKLKLDSQLAGMSAYFDSIGVAAPAVQPEADTAEPAAEQKKSSCAEKAVALLKEKNKKVYFADTPSCEMVKDVCGEEIIKDTFIFTDYTSARDNEAPRSYIADLARYAIPDGEDAFGAAVSNVYTGTSQETGERKYNIYVALADKNTSRVLRFASQPGEIPEELIAAAIEFLMDMMCEKCAELSAPVAIPEVKTEVADSAEEQASAQAPENEPESVTEEPAEELEEPTPQEKQKKKRTGLRVVLYTILALLLAFAGYFVYSGIENAEENKASAQSSFASYFSQGAAAESGSLLIFPEYVPDFYGETTLPEDMTTLPEETTDETTAEDVTDSYTSESTSAEEAGKVTEQKTTAATTAMPTTTAKPTTTRKPTTTKKVTTTAKPTTTVKTNQPGKVSGKFVFTVYGYGHGVGMSQEGALGYSRAGSSYTNILLHYYPGVTLVKSDPNMPETVRFGGKDYPLVEYLCRSVVGEISSGCNSSTAEAFKAQAVALYTYAKRYGFNINASLHAFNTSYKYEGTAVETAVKSVLGEYLAYNGRAIDATFYAMSAGRTTVASKVWGRNAYPYLEKSVDSPHDKKCAKYKTEYTITAEDFRDLMKKTVGVDLQGDPANWIRIVKHDSAVSSSVGYVEEITVGGKSMRGAYFRSNAMQYKIRSHCFSVRYVEG